jgi:hypothetical protein
MRPSPKGRARQGYHLFIAPWPPHRIVPRDQGSEGAKTSSGIELSCVERERRALMEMQPMMAWSCERERVDLRSAQKTEEAR